MNAQREHKTEYVDKCRNCSGTGRKSRKIALIPYKTDCEVCGGSGLVMITKTIITEVEPYKPNSK